MQHKKRDASRNRALRMRPPQPETTTTLTLVAEAKCRVIALVGDPEAATVVAERGRD